MMPLPILPRCALTSAAGLLLAGCTGARPAADPPPAPAAALRIVPSCVVSDEGLVAITVEVDPATHDTTFQGAPLSAAFPLTSRYAAEAGWYVRNEPIPEAVWPHVNARGNYEKYGRPRRFPADSLILIGRHHGVGAYIAPDDAGSNYGILYVPVRPGCWFQLYQFVGVGEMREGR